MILLSDSVESYMEALVPFAVESDESTPRIGLKMLTSSESESLFSGSGLASPLFFFRPLPLSDCFARRPK